MSACSYLHIAAFSGSSWGYLKGRVMGVEEIVAFTGLERNSLKIVENLV